MITAALTLGGWLAAALAGAAALGARHAAGERREAVARACHELRGPLTAARLGLHLAPGRDSLPAARLRAIDAELGRAALAVDDLLAPARRRGGLADLARIDVRALLADSVEAWQASAAAAGSAIVLEWPGRSAAVWGDRARLAQALGNLIANALEHGAGTVSVRARGRDATLRICVADDGPGLPAPVAALCGGARRRDDGAGRLGRGRGLGIVAHVASAHGGRLAAAPSPRGARLVLELPVAGGAGPTVV